MIRMAMCAAALVAAISPVLAGAEEVSALGAKIFVTEKCTLCHSIAKKGNVKGPLDEVGSKLSTDEIRAWIVDAKTMTAKTGAARKPEMKAYTLPKEDVDALVGYLAALKKK
jgi:cytochrome c2